MYEEGGPPVIDGPGGLGVGLHFRGFNFWDDTFKHLNQIFNTYTTLCQYRSQRLQNHSERRIHA